MHDQCRGNLTVNRRKIQIRNDPFPVLRSRRNVRIFTLVPTCCRNPVSYIYRRGSFSTFQGFLKFSTFMVCVCMRVRMRVCVCMERQSNQKALHLQYHCYRYRKIENNNRSRAFVINYKNRFLSSFFFKKYLFLLTFFILYLISDLYPFFHTYFISLESLFHRKIDYILTIFCA